MQWSVKMTRCKNKRSQFIKYFFNNNFKKLLYLNNRMRLYLSDAMQSTASSELKNAYKNSETTF